jgi:hypothetical protein
MFCLLRDPVPSETNSASPDEHYCFCNRAIYSKPETEATSARQYRAEAGRRAEVQNAIRLFAELDFHSCRVYKLIAIKKEAHRLIHEL